VDVCFVSRTLATNTYIWESCYVLRLYDPFPSPLSFINMQILISSAGIQDEEISAHSCAQQPIFHPHTHPDNISFNKVLLMNPSFRELAAQRLSGAVRIPSITYDGMGKVGEDPRWGVFSSFTKYLQDTFPTL
jgi:hypothetical protein